jgi:ABC-type multidrug transport system fused ATPase/permease subunit
MFWILGLLQSLRSSQDCLDEVPQISFLRISTWPKNVFAASFVALDKKIFLVNLISLVCSSVVQICNQYVLFGALLRFLGDKTQTMWFGWMIASVFLVVQLALIFFGVWIVSVASRRSVRHSAALKVKVSHVLIESAFGVQVSTSQMCNAIIPELVFLCDAFLITLNALIMVMALTAIVYLFLGWVMFTLLGLVALAQLSTIPLGYAEGKIQDKLYEAARKRILTFEEIVLSIFHVKIQGLQRKFISLVSDARSEELWSYVRYFTMPGAFPSFFATFGGDVLLYGITFGIGGVIDLANLLVSFPLISIFQFETLKISNFLFGFGRFRVSATSFEGFTKCETIKPRKMEVLSFCGIEAKNCSFIANEKFSVQTVSFTIRTGQWLFVCGPSGSGKSTLILGLLGERELKEGDIVLSGTLALAPQTPWLLEGTIRTNILFGKKFEEERFWGTVAAVGLLQDLSEFQGKDLFHVSDAGSNLSGGQRQRISLARAMYAKTNIICFDDCLSALDAKVKNFVFGQMKVMCSSQCVVFSTTETTETFDAVSVLENGNFSLLRPPSSQPCIAGQSEDFGEGEPLVLLSIPAPTRVSTPRRHWVLYVKSAGFFLACFVIARFCFEALNVFARFWVTLWLQGFWTFSALLWVLYYLAIFGGAIIIFFVSDVSLAGFAFMAAKKIHEASVSALIKTSMNFFDMNQPKNVCSRFSNDVRTLDDIFPLSFSNFLIACVTFLSVIAVMAYIFPISLVGFPILVFSCLFVYFQVADETFVLQKIQTNVLANSLSLINTCFLGRVSFRLFGNRTSFIRLFERQLQIESSIAFAVRMLQAWISASLQLLVAIYFFGASMIAIFLGGSFGGLFLVYGLQLGNVIAETVRSALYCQRIFIGVSRVLEYSELLPESLSSLEAPSNWPSEGRIEFSNVSFSYAEHLPLVLKNLSIAFRSGTSSGVVGRTGAGKSSVFLALFGMYKISGCVSIDSFDVRQFEPDSMRFRLSFVPQEPTFFQGSLRQNLDPEGVAITANIYELLDCFGIVSTNLDGQIPENRGDLQKLSLVRGMLKKSKVVCIDEGSAALEREASEKLTILLMQLPSTKIIIAHHLEAVMKCDQIVVLDKGRVVEIDHPKALVDKQSVFRALVQAGGDATGNKLESLASERKEITGCFICRQAYSKLQTKVECKRCSQFVCCWCAEYRVCMYCWANSEKEKDFIFAVNAARRPSEKKGFPCQNCSLPFTQECAKCSKFFCGKCLIRFRDIWGTKTSNACKECWLMLKEEFSEIDQDESGAEIFQGDNFIPLESDCAFGTCLICRKKGVNEKCRGCSSFICGSCSGFVLAPDLSSTRLVLLCSSCMRVKPIMRQLFGEPCGFFTLTDWQAKLIEDKQMCSACSSVLHFFQQPYSCSRCENVVCRHCYKNSVCENCQEGRTGKNLSEVLICDECGNACPIKSVVWLNDRRFHPECVVNFRRKGGVLCAFCNQVALQSQGTCIFNGKSVHNNCLVPFKKQQAQML